MLNRMTLSHWAEDLKRNKTPKKRLHERFMQLIAEHPSMNPDRPRTIAVQGGVVRHPDERPVHAGGCGEPRQTAIEIVADEIARKRIVVAPVSTRDTDLLDIAETKEQP